jgi:hypothetical protein
MLAISICQLERKQCQNCTQESVHEAPIASTLAFTRIQYPIHHEAQTSHASVSHSQNFKSCHNVLVGSLSRHGDITQHTRNNHNKVNLTSCFIFNAQALHSHAPASYSPLLFLYLSCLTAVTICQSSHLSSLGRSHQVSEMQQQSKLKHLHRLLLVSRHRCSVLGHSIWKSVNSKDL